MVQVKQQAYGEGWSVFAFGRNAARKNNVFAELEAVAFVNRPWLAHCHPHHECPVLKLTTVQFMNGIGQANIL